MCVREGVEGKEEGYRSESGVVQCSRQGHQQPHHIDQQRQQQYTIWSPLRFAPHCLRYRLTSIVPTPALICLLHTHTSCPLFSHTYLESN